jgi:hypothetical protein
MSGPGSSTGLLTLNSSGVLAFTGSGATFNAALVTATKLINTGTTFQIATPRQIPSSTSVGIPGEFCWELASDSFLWLYLCYATNSWRRIQFPFTTW